MTRADRNKAFREQVEKAKDVIRKEMIDQNKGIAVQAFHQDFTRNGQFASAQALEELLPEIEAAGLNADGHGPSTHQKNQLDEILKEARREERERARKRDNERVYRMVGENRRRAQGGIDLDAIRNAPHGSALESPTGTVDSEDERYEREMREFEVKRREAQRGGYAYSLTPPEPPKKRRQPISPY